jgi:hypothetical protein
MDILDLEVHFSSSPHQQEGHFMVSSLLSAVFLQVRKGFPSEQFGFCTDTRLLLLQILFVSLDR